MLKRKKDHSFSVILPSYQPSGNWAQLFIRNVTELNAILPESMSVAYIIVHDGTVQPHVEKIFSDIFSRFKNIQFISYPENKGKGYALREGIRTAKSDFIVVTDFDFPYKKKNLVELMIRLTEGYDVVVGKRSKNYFKQLPFRRKIISWFCILLKKIFLDLPLYDTQSGIKAFNKNGKDIFLQTKINRFLIDTEFILLSHRNGLSIKEVNIELESYVQFSRFGFKVIKNEMNNFLKLILMNKRLRKLPAA